MLLSGSLESVVAESSGSDKGQTCGRLAHPEVKACHGRFAAAAGSFCRAYANCDVHVTIG